MVVEQVSKEIKKRYVLYQYQVEKLKEYNLTHDDALVLRTICDMYSNAGNDFIIHDNDKYVWINLTYISEFLDIIGSKKTFIRMFDKFVEKGLIDKVVKKSRNGKSGTYGYYKPTVKLSMIEEVDSKANNNNASEQETKSPLIKRQNVLSSRDKMSSNQETKCPSKDSTLFDSTTNDSNINKDVSHFLSLYPNKRGIGRISGRIEKLIQQYGMEQLERVIARYMAYCEENKKWYRPKDLSTFVNSGHKEYLDDIVGYKPNQQAEVQKKKIQQTEIDAEPNRNRCYIEQDWA